MTWNPADIIFAILRRRPIVTSLVFLAALSLFTVSLSSTYHAARSDRADGYFLEGRRLEEAGESGAAADHYRDALALDRSSIEYRQALVRALIDSGGIAEAENHLIGLLQQQPMGSEANLLLARILWERGDLLAADDYYQRAIYGLWPDDPLERRTETRFEFVQRLIEAERSSRALVELLQLAEELPVRHPEAGRTARIMLDLNAAREAADLFQAMTEANPGAVDAWTGLGESLMAAGSFVEARDALLRARSLAPGSTEIRSLLQTSESVLALDPNREGLPDRERLRRSRSLAEQSLAAVDACVERYSPELGADEAEVLEQARIVAADAAPADDAVEAAIAAIVRLAPVLKRVCQEIDIDPGVLKVVEKLSQ